MAKINNQEVMQKLIDELKLYPGKDVIPTELAEKILPTFQVNQDDVNVNLKPNYYLWQDITANDSDKTFTVPDGHTYVIKFGFIKITPTATVGNREIVIDVKDGAGTLIWRIDLTLWPAAATNVKYFRITTNGVIADDPTDGGNFDNILAVGTLTPEFPLKENYTVRVYDSNTVDAAADDMEVSFMVEDIED